MSRSWLLAALLALLALSLLAAAPAAAHEAEVDDAQLADFELEMEGFDGDETMMMELGVDAEGDMEAEAEAESEFDADSFAELGAEAEVDAEAETEVDAESELDMEAEAESDFEADLSLLELGAAPRYTYSQRSGIFTFPNGRRVQCYSGKGAEINNPAKQCVKNKGPLPRGVYTIGPRHRHRTTGADSMRLTPARGNAMCGRAGFLIHGGRFTSARSGPSSQGCIIMPLTQRRQIVRGGILTVTV